MQRLLLFTLISFATCAFADTTLDVTVPGGTGVCSYTTGAVTSTTAGHLQATAISMTGSGCGSGGAANLPVEFGPASQLAPSATMLPGKTGSVGYTFQPLHATQCNASITGGNGSSTASFSGGNNLCSNATCNNLVTATANFVNNSTTADAAYTISVTCSGAGSPATTSSTVSVPHQAGGGGSGTCPTIASSTPTAGSSFSRWTETQTVFYYGQGAGTGNQHVDVASFESVWFAPWPGGGGRSPLFRLPLTKYMAQQFTVPPNYFTAANMPPDLYGEYMVGESAVDAKVSMTISRSCGDFSNPATNPTSTVPLGCYLNKGGPNTFLLWRPSSNCQLTSGTTYYLNIINADISQVLPGGGGTAASTSISPLASCTSSGGCQLPLKNTGNFSGYVPQ